MVNNSRLRGRGMTSTYSGCPEDDYVLPDDLRPLDISDTKEMFDRLESLIPLLYFKCSTGHGSELTVDQQINIYSNA